MNAFLRAVSNPLAVAIAVIGTVTAASAADLTGTWDASAVYERDGQIVYTTTPVCNFEQSDDQISGTCKGPHASGPASGSIHGATVSWQWQATANATGQTGVSTWTGTLDPDGTIRGKMSGAALPGVRVPFTAQKR